MINKTPPIPFNPNTKSPLSSTIPPGFNFINTSKLHSDDTTCTICNKRFKSLTAIFDHMNSVHKDKIQPANITVGPILLKNIEKIFNCFECNDIFKSVDELKYHLYSIHKNYKHDEYLCHTCNKYFGSKVAIYDHLNSQLHADSKDFNCNECNKYFNSKAVLDDHIRYSHVYEEIIYNCTECNEKFKSELILNKHLMHIHHKYLERKNIHLSFSGDPQHKIISSNQTSPQPPISTGIHKSPEEQTARRPFPLRSSPVELNQTLSPLLKDLSQKPHINDEPLSFSNITIDHEATIIQKHHNNNNEQSLPRNELTLNVSNSFQRLSTSSNEISVSSNDISMSNNLLTPISQSSLNSSYINLSISSEVTDKAPPKRIPMPLKSMDKSQFLNMLTNDMPQKSEELKDFKSRTASPLFGDVAPPNFKVFDNASPSLLSTAQYSPKLPRMNLTPTNASLVKRNSPSLNSMALTPQSGSLLSSNHSSNMPFMTLTSQHGMVPSSYNTIPTFIPQISVIQNLAPQNLAMPPLSMSAQINLNFEQQPDSRFHQISFPSYMPTQPTYPQKRPLPIFKPPQRFQAPAHSTFPSSFQSNFPPPIQSTYPTPPFSNASSNFSQALSANLANTSGPHPSINYQNNSLFASSPPVLSNPLKPTYYETSYYEKRNSYTPLIQPLLSPYARSDGSYSPADEKLLIRNVNNNIIDNDISRFRQDIQRLSKDLTRINSSSKKSMTDNNNNNGDSSSNDNGVSSSSGSI